MREEQKARGLKPRYDGRCRDRTKLVPDALPVTRFKNPSAGQVSFGDRIHGEVTFENSEPDDLVILRSDEVPTYNFSVVVDDSDMGITHVVRGDDHNLHLEFQPGPEDPWSRRPRRLFDQSDLRTWCCAPVYSGIGSGGPLSSIRLPSGSLRYMQGP